MLCQYFHLFIFLTNLFVHFLTVITLLQSNNGRQNTTKWTCSYIIIIILQKHNNCTLIIINDLHFRHFNHWASVQNAIHPCSLGRQHSSFFILRLNTWWPHAAIHSLAAGSILIIIMTRHRGRMYTNVICTMQRHNVVSLWYKYPLQHAPLSYCYYWVIMGIIIIHL